MNPEFKGLNNVTFFVSGKAIATGLMAVDMETTPLESPFVIGSLEGTITMTSCEVYPQLLGPMDIIVSHMAPYKKPRSKKKRIQKKYAKKFTMSQTTYKNCTIGGLE